MFKSHILFILCHITSWSMQQVVIVEAPVTIVHSALRPSATPSETYELSTQTRDSIYGIFQSAVLQIKGIIGSRRSNPTEQLELVLSIHRTPDASNRTGNPTAAATSNHTDEGHHVVSPLARPYMQYPDQTDPNRNLYIVSLTIIFGTIIGVVIFGIYSYNTSL